MKFQMEGNLGCMANYFTEIAIVIKNACFARSCQPCFHERRKFCAEDFSSSLANLLENDTETYNYYSGCLFHYDFRLLCFDGSHGI